MEYHLRLCLQSTNCRALSIQAIANPHLTIQFESRTEVHTHMACVGRACAEGGEDSLASRRFRSQGLLVHDSWIDLATFGSENALTDLYNHGIRVPQQGQKFVVGTLNAQGTRSNRQHPAIVPSVSYGDSGRARGGKDFVAGPSAKRVHKFLLCKVGVGRPYRVNETALAATAVPALPQGFDSFYLVQDTERREEGTGFAGPKQYRHEYVVLDPLLVLPCYVVEFEYDPDGELRQRVRVCLCSY